MHETSCARRHVGEQLPDRLAFALRVKVPDGVDDGGERQMDDAFLRPEPAQLRVARERRARTPAKSDGDVVDVPADDEMTVSGSIASAQTSLPRPIVNVRPCPSMPASVLRITYAAE